MYQTKHLFQETSTAFVWAEAAEALLHSDWPFDRQNPNVAPH